MIWEPSMFLGVDEEGAGIGMGVEEVSPCNERSSMAAVDTRKSCGRPVT